MEAPQDGEHAEMTATYFLSKIIGINLGALQYVLF